MAIEATAAAKTLENSEENVSSHQLISLLMQGALERVDQTRQKIEEGNEQDALVLAGKIIAIIGGLRSSLDFDQGGQIATNLDALYDYMLGRIDSAEGCDRLHAFNEVEQLLGEVKQGWDKIESSASAPLGALSLG